MTLTAIFILIYAVSALIVGAVHWARHYDDKKDNRIRDMEEKVVSLYVVPLVPVVNSCLAFVIIFNFMMF